MLCLRVGSRGLTHHLTRVAADVFGASFFGIMAPWTRYTRTIEEFAAEGYTHVESSCPRCRVIRLRPMEWLPRISMGLTIAQLSERLRCADCGSQLHSVKPWRMEDALGKPVGRRA